MFDIRIIDKKYYIIIQVFFISSSVFYGSFRVKEIKLNSPEMQKIVVGMTLSDLPYWHKYHNFSFDEANKFLIFSRIKVLLILRLIIKLIRNFIHLF